MTNLISGKEAKLAWANGEDVQISHKHATLKKEWHDLYGTLMLSAFDSDIYEFRLKPRTITINGIEVPCCGEDYQYGDAMYILNSLEPEEYSLVVLDKVDEVPLYWWRTEEEIKQVVEALRQIFGLSDDAVNAARGGK